MDQPPTSFIRDRRTVRGLGLPGSLPPEVVAPAAQAVAAGGYHSFWLNNPPGGNALASLGAVAGNQPTLTLGVGVIPLSHRDAAEIADDARASGVPLERLYLGIGSGAGPGGVERVAEGIRRLRGTLATTIVVAALGPRMCRLAGREADGVLLNWLTPEHAVTSVEWVAGAAREAGRPVPRLMAYVRAALGDAATARLHQEAERYARIPAYAAHFDRMGVAAAETAIVARDATELHEGLAAWNGIVDEVVIRAVAAEDTAEALRPLIEAGAHAGEQPSRGGT